MAAFTDIPSTFHTGRRRSSVTTAPYSIPGARSSAYPSPPSSVSSSMGSSYTRKMLVARRASEGESGRLKEELKCEKCGKGYKHISCLTKHQWEHTPEWTVTSKLLMSKHQQVQLLEAASILVSMTDEEVPSSQGYSSSSDIMLFDEDSIDEMDKDDDDDEDVGFNEDDEIFGKMEE
ncbi:uncharacterized protein V1510DRAFT_130473 [Dipodascopsis tothii]|uniref:uncharacterized protein n=1 Tax=Dipodascopsis tothii TaxID=44089 RepID=UPI0034CD5F31